MQATSMFTGRLANALPTGLVAHIIWAWTHTTLTAGTTTTRATLAADAIRHAFTSPFIALLPTSARTYKTHFSGRRTSSVPQVSLQLSMPQLMLKQVLTQVPFSRSEQSLPVQPSSQTQRCPKSHDPCMHLRSSLKITSACNNYGGEQSRFIVSALFS